MTVQMVAAIQNFQGLAADTKPTAAPVGSTFHETDTGRRFVWDRASWLDVVGSIHDTTMTALPGMSTAAYAAGDALGTELTLSDIPLAGLIHSVKVVDLSKQEIEFDLYIATITLTTGSTNNAVYSPDDADLSNHVGHITVTNADYIAFDDNAIATVRNVGLLYSSTPGSLFVQAVTRGAPTYAATTDLKIALSIIST